MRLRTDVVLQTAPRGVGRAAAHHGEVMQGMFEDSQGRLHRGLITMPCPLFGATAWFAPSTDPEVRCSHAWKVKAKRAAELALAHCEASGIGGDLAVVSDVPIGHGLGSSTSDVIAAIHAVFDALAIDRSASTVAEIAVRAEGASDSIMFTDRAVLFAQREGVVLEEFGRTLPPVHVLGVLTEPDHGIDTLATPAACYSAAELRAFRDMLGRARRAIAEQRADLLGEVASASARISQRHLPKPAFDRLERIAADSGALGIQVAHSGTVVGFLYAPDLASQHERFAEVAARLGELGLRDTWRYALPA